MTDIEQKKAAKEFAERWNNKGYEKGESQKYWIDLLEHVLGVPNAIQFIRFEDNIRIDKASGFIDGFIDKTKVLIEQKSITKDLRKAILQSDGSLLNPFQQAKRYSAELPYDDRPRWIIACNFKSMLVYDMNNPNGEPEEILLKDLPKEYYRLSFLVNSKGDHLKKEEELSFKAGELVGRLYDSFSKEYKDINNEQSQKDLNELCVRLVFCLYSEDAGLFGRKNVFHDYLSKYDDLDQMRKAVIELFKILDTPLDKRDSYLDDSLNQFPYVNGGLFSNENIEIPRFNQEIRETLLAKASDDFDWSEISPTIFGAVFESTLNPETRRAGGMHYTSIENIHKVIDPLFLNELRERLNEAESYKNEKTRNEKLYEFQNYISSLKFLDPACGSGNFLTESYLSLRRLENEAIQVQQGKGAISISTNDQIKVSIQQFYGIEINDFAVKVAKTALWIAEAQMYEETQRIVYNGRSITEFLPLETYNNIVEGNALRIDWNDLLPNSECNYIMGNPPFVGHKNMSESQKNDMIWLFDSKQGRLDLVSAWYLKAAKYFADNKIEASFVSTNSIVQGVHLQTLWENLEQNYGIKINFAYQTFPWTSEANKKAHVHCVIIGFAKFDRKEKFLFTNSDKYGNQISKKVEKINAYLSDDDSVIVNSRNKPLCDIPEMIYGNIPRDGGFYTFTCEEMQEFITNEPLSKKYFHKFVGSNEYINNFYRNILFLENADPSEIKKMPMVLDRIEKVKEFRLNSKADEIKKFALTPLNFAQTTQPIGEPFIIVPIVSSEKRKYIPIGFIEEDVITNNAVQIIPNATVYDFGILTSNVHMAWMRVTASRLESRYRYLKNVVYNNFPWPNPTKEQKEKIEKTAQAILDARAKYSNSSLADLYDELTMPSELRRAHQENDKAVMEAYGFDWKNMTESECVSKLMEMYQDLSSKN